MSKVLLALADLGMAMPLQESLEAAGHQVTWDGSQAAGPTGAGAPDVVILAATDALADGVRAWRDADPPPALLVAGAGARERELAHGQGVAFAGPGADLAQAIAAIERLRFAGRLSPSYARGALGLGTAAGDGASEALRIITRHRAVPLDIVSEALRNVVHHYALADAELVALLREHRALQIPEVGLVEKMDGARTVQTLVQRSGLEAPTAGRLVWALASIGALRLTPEPADAATPARRAVLSARQHLRARHRRLERATHYDVLEVHPAATAADADRAARMLALRFSPERLGALDLGDLEPLVAPTWHAILVARQVLMSPTDRALYDDSIWSRQRELDAPWAFEERRPQRAEESFRRGQQALVDGEPFKAVSAMAGACRDSPGHPDYEASLAWARYRAELHRGTEREAIVGKERAAAEEALAGRRPWPRALMALGLLCAAAGDAGAARWHLHEALSVDPNLPAAHQLLRRLGEG